MPEELKASEETSRLFAALRAPLSQAGQLAKRIEETQAATPLHDHVAQLQASLDRGKLPVVLWPLDAECLPAAREWVTRLPSTDLWIVSPQASAATLSSLASKAAVLFVAATADPADDGPLGLLPSVSPLFSVVRLLVCGGHQAQRCQQAVAAASRTLPVLALTAGGEPAGPDQLSSEAFLRIGGAVLTWFHARNGFAACELLERQIEGEQQQEQVRRRLIATRIADISGRARAVTGGGWQARLSTAVEGLERRLSEAAADRLAKSNLAWQRVAQLVEDLSEHDLAEEHAGHHLRLSLSGDAQHSAVTLVRTAVEEAVRCDDRLLDGEISVLCISLPEMVSLNGTACSELLPPRLEIEPALHALRDATQSDCRYRGEIPAYTLFDRLSHGRRPVFAVTMIMSLVGAAVGMRSQFATWLAPLLLLLFIGGFLYTFRSFRREREDHLSRELFRAKETFFGELRRMIETAVRDWQTRAIRHLRDVQRELSRQMDDLGRAREQALLERDQSERRVLDDQMKQVDQRIRSLAAVAQDAKRLSAEFESLRTAADKNLQKVWEGVRHVH